ncbi:lytic transglycosylase domain-containing protein [Mycolicibacter longobardus]|uniref:Lytic transglycosylase n=1 Tax=Mycolicibacter longobardus TaxID=1108812 RepID=A0A1X1YC89_9MYCO|nr:lytic murein transglycosylase [Mycolicibacter longobardus]ORW08689.1 lytic transglycosylase [Mycolicibacter longobardus]
MPTGGGATEHLSRAAKWRRAARAALRPAFGLTFITPLVFAGAVGATPRSPSTSLPLRNAAVTPLAASVNTSSSGRSSGPSVVAVQRKQANLHVAAGALSAPPAAVVYAPGTLGIPKTALAAYRNAEQQMAVAAPECGISWNLLAGIGRIESSHANGGATDVHGTVLQPIYGPSLDGSLPGNEVIVQSSAPGRVVYARAMGPMQFLPGTWARYAADGDGDGRADPQNVYDATLAAARYLCSGGLNLREQNHVLTAILRYNNSMAYAENVMGWAAAYATGVAPVDLPPIVGPAPGIADRRLEHLEQPEGLGPESLSMHGISPVDHTAGSSLIDLGQSGMDTQLTNMPWVPPWMTTTQQQQLPRPSAACRMICLEPQAAATPSAAPDAVAPDPFAPPQAPFGSAPAPFGPPEAPPAPMPAYAVPPAPMAPPEEPAGLPPQPAPTAPPVGPQPAPPA